ncbi:hypothetical protein FHS29_001110 [Saccharothrix tamanrassetensis]|uniref:Uncharacterized protein n=1 Tax=Saccharothrix tamanrassetensis TaxID=1051531 RepID=A0A841CC37_9PSEU|nr:hypothetical protein [Saccharothrix tamanrassetensis]MBB5954540.1 hypothetical protein [Saccharothrix tamanrassetensis]
MSEAELRESLRAAVVDEPPLNFDADALIQRAKMVRKRRRALVAVAVATVALTASVLSLPGALSSSRGGGQVDALVPVLTTTTPTPVAEAKVEDRAEYLAAYLEERFEQVVPDVAEVRAEFTDTRLKKAAGYVTGFVYFVDREGSSGISVQLSRPPMLVTRDEFCAGVKCDAPRYQEDGSYLEFATSSVSGHDMITYSVAHFRADGSVVQVSGYNYDPAKGGKIRDEVPISVDQMVSLATDPNLAAD